MMFSGSCLLQFSWCSSCSGRIGLLGGSVDFAGGHVVANHLPASSEVLGKDDQKPFWKKLQR